jgi:hypothetical protein
MNIPFYEKIREIQMNFENLFGAAIFNGAEKKVVVLAIEHLTFEMGTNKPFTLILNHIRQYNYVTTTRTEEG